MLARLARGLRFRVGSQGQIAFQPTFQVVLHLDELIEAYPTPSVFKIAKLALCGTLTLENPLGNFFIELKAAQIAKGDHRTDFVNAMNKPLPFGTVFERCFSWKLLLIPEHLARSFHLALSGVATISCLPDTGPALPPAKFRPRLLPGDIAVIRFVCFLSAFSCHSYSSSRVAHCL